MNENEYRFQLDQCENEIKFQYRNLRNQILRVEKVTRKETGTLKSFFVPCGIFTGIALGFCILAGILSLLGSFFPVLVGAGVVIGLCSVPIFILGLIIAGASVSDASALRAPIEKNRIRLKNYVKDIGEI